VLNRVSYHALALLICILVTRPHSRTRDAGYPYAIVKEPDCPRSELEARFSKRQIVWRLDERTSSTFNHMHGADGHRTHDLRLAKPALSQLSYSPVDEDVGLGRVELPTSPLSGARSSQLSYRPSLIFWALASS
jgi:hypothetical protein